MDSENIYESLKKIAECPGNHLEVLLACLSILYSTPYEKDNYLIDDLFAKNAYMKLGSARRRMAPEEIRYLRKKFLGDE